MGQSPKGKKEIQGDMKTPEGNYRIIDRNPNSSVCYLNLGISYPKGSDIKNARENSKPPGGDIEIHGLPNGYGFIGKFHRWKDWTWGCIAVTNREMKELYDNVPIVTEIEIKE